VEWRVIKYAEYDAAFNMAIDEAILENCMCGGCAPTIRFYGWKQPSITIGRLQRDYKAPYGWSGSIVRRPTGGRAVYHGSDLTFSVVVEAELLGSPIAESYRIVGEAAAEALRSLGVPAEFIRRRTPSASMRGIDDCFKLSTEYELEAGGIKVLGSAQMRRAGYVLQQNSLAPAAGIDWPPKEKIADAITYALSKKIGADFRPANFLPNEMTRAEELVRIKYGCDEWNAHCINPENMTKAQVE